MVQDFYYIQRKKDKKKENNLVENNTAKNKNRFEAKRWEKIMKQNYT